MPVYTREQRQSAVELFIECKSHAAVANALGYPSRWALDRWHQEFLDTGAVKESRPKWFKFSEEQKRTAVAHYLENGRNLSATVRALGYPSRALLGTWTEELPPGERKRQRSTLGCSTEQKLDAVLALCAKDTTADKLALEQGVDKTSLYAWRRQLLGEEPDTIMADISDGQLPDDVESLQKMKDSLAKDLRRLKLELAVHRGAIELVKEDPGADPKRLTNKEKTILIDALRTDYGLRELLGFLHLARSSYFYQRKAMSLPDKYEKLRARIAELFGENQGRYGYRRIHGLLRREGTAVSEKTVRAIMRDTGLTVACKRRRKYSSYQGEDNPAADNIINRDFTAQTPNLKWLTDLTEFHIPAGKVYLSPIVDCFDGMLVSWTIGTRPDAELVNTMLDSAIGTLGEGERPLLHNDRGCHYRWPGWIERTTKAGIIRSMSKKGCSPDNAACEGVFGRIKNEMFYNRSWAGVSIEEFIAILDAYLRWYNETRIKVSLGAMSPLEYRQSLGLAA